MVEQARRLASKSIPWRSLPYLREAALADIQVVAKLYGDDLLDISPGESFLNLREARELLESIPASRWRHCLNKQGELKPAALGNSVDVLEIFSGCGYIVYIYRVYCIPSGSPPAHRRWIVASPTRTTTRTIARTAPTKGSQILNI